MAVKIRLARHGRKKRPFYHIVVADARSPRDGRFIEKLGYYNPMTSPATIEVDRDRAFEWLMKGAQPTDTLRAILRFKGVMYRKHLMRGVKNGVLTEEQAMLKYNEFIEAKDAKIAKRFEQSALDKEEWYKKVSGTAKAVVAEEVVAEAAETPVVETPVEAVVEKVAEVKEAVDEKVAEVKETASEIIADVKEAVEEKVAEVKEAITTSADETAEAKDAVTIPAEEAKDAVTEAKEAVAIPAEEPKDAVTEAKEAVTIPAEAAEDVVAEAKDAVTIPAAEEPAAKEEKADDAEA